MFLFGPWLPDIAPLNSGAATVARNVIPARGSYRPFKRFLAVATALSSRVMGAVSARATQTQQIFNFSATATNIFKLGADGLAWSDVSRLVGGSYLTAQDGYWQFVQFGDYIIALNKSDAPQYFDLSTSTRFAALAGSPPNSQFGVVVRDFVLLGGLSDNLNRVQWSGINAPDDYIPSTTTMSDYQDFPEGGRVMGLAGGDVGVVFFERAIYRMSFEGPPLIFRFDKIATSIGCRASRSIATHEGLTFFLAYDGLYMIRGASELTPIGSEKVDLWISKNINPAAINRVTSAIDPVNKIYLMGFPSVSSDSPDMALLYHWPTGQFALIDLDHELLYSGSRQEGLTIDGMDSIAATIDDLPYTIDSLFYSGVGQVSLAAFDGTSRMGFFDGVNMEATVETGDIQLSSGRKSLLRSIRALVDGSFVGQSLVVRSRNIMNETLTDSSSVGATPTGKFNTRVNARYHRGRLIVPQGSDWSHIIGLDDAAFSPMGER